MSPIPQQQGGVMIIEALIGILIFMIGILALIAMQATAIRATQDARYRTEAVNYANDLLNKIVVNVDRTTPTTLQTSLNTFQHRPTTNAHCSFSGAESANPLLLDCADLVAGTSALTPPPRKPLPGAADTMVQVLVDTSAGAYNTLSITLCWRAPDDPVARKHVLMSYIS
jgi:type IV pilus assembly protein PilV